MKIAVLERINAYTGQCSNVDGLCSALEEWLTRNRWSKFIVNAVRVYEHFDNEWRLPLWDKELIEWWYRIPLRLRVNSVLYHRFLFERLFDPMNVGFRKPPSFHVRTAAVKRWLPTATIPAVRWFFCQALGKFLRKRYDVNAFDDASRILLKQLPSKWNFADFGNINGVVAVWCDAHCL